ncbi:hypothetical protein [Brevibacillus brevis]|uniref:hypothetical protein n=1 Tax=Brevibacillus brevis TaxID=1393 RepID=UPI0025A5B43F|nr:hypothetical protein [Brevibacillus brevis]WJQ82897.1 hypothetical protein QN310_07115 [Brevibacillus brevis]
MPEILRRPTALPTSYLVDAIYEGVTGEERPSLERNDLARGAVETATNAVNYVGDTVTGNKSCEQIKSDAKSFDKGYTMTISTHSRKTPNTIKITCLKAVCGPDQKNKAMRRVRMSLRKTWWLQR